MKDETAEELRQAVFGANDGLVSTFGLVAGLIGAAASQQVLILANVVNMFAAGMSMGLGSYLATKSAKEYQMRIEKDITRSITETPQIAHAELREILKKQGVKNVAVHLKRLTHREQVAILLQEKHGLALDGHPNPVRGGTIMFFVFVGCGIIPIIPLFFAQGINALLWSTLFTSIALFAVGALKQKLTGRTWLSLGVENLMIGAITGTVGFIAGVWTSSLMG